MTTQRSDPFACLSDVSLKTHGGNRPPASVLDNENLGKLPERATSEQVLDWRPTMFRRSHLLRSVFDLPRWTRVLISFHLFSFVIVLFLVCSSLGSSDKPRTHRETAEVRRIEKYFVSSQLLQLGSRCNKQDLLFVPCVDFEVNSELLLELVQWWDLDLHPD